MDKVQTKLTSQGQVSVPAAVRSFLHLIPGSVLVWTQEGDRIVVERARRHSTAEVHQVLFPEPPPGGAAARTLAELKQGVRLRMQRRHAGR
jgi:antitoxin PrlF